MKYAKYSDLGLVSALSCYGFEIKSIHRINKFKVEFWIDHSERLENIVRLYFLGRLQVEPMALLNKVKTLKTRINNTI